MLAMQRILTSSFPSIASPIHTKSLTPRMAVFSTAHMACAFGILGNIVSFLVYLAPLPTFYRIWRRKSTEGFQSIPYSVALFSAMLYLYYAFLKTNNGTMLITINCLGCAIEVSYLILFMIYATNESKVCTTKLLVLFNVVAYGVIILCTFLLSHGDRRVSVVGWICAVFSVLVFAAPLSIMTQVIKTKSVEYMPFSLSCCLTFCAIVWFFYGYFINDYYIAAPNILGFLFGIIQMVLYIIYKNKKKQILPIVKLQELTTIEDLNTRAIKVETPRSARVQPEDIAMGEDAENNTTNQPSV